MAMAIEEGVPAGAWGQTEFQVNLKLGLSRATRKGFHLMSPLTEIAKPLWTCVNFTTIISFSQGIYVKEI